MLATMTRLKKKQARREQETTHTESRWEQFAWVGGRTIRRFLRMEELSLFGMGEMKTPEHGANLPALTKFGGLRAIS